MKTNGTISIPRFTEINLLVQKLKVRGGGWGWGIHIDTVIHKEHDIFFKLHVSILEGKVG